MRGCNWAFGFCQRQGLAQRLQEKEARIASLEERLAYLEGLVAILLASRQQP